MSEKLSHDMSIQEVQTEIRKLQDILRVRLSGRCYCMRCRRHTTTPRRIEK